MFEPETVDVCICTYRRASLADTLRSIAAQQLPSGLNVRVIVADNDDAPSARPIVDRARAEFGLDCRYLEAPARNISIARNACLETTDAPLFAFIDDDEIAAPDWLSKLVAEQRRSEAPVVFGPVHAVYGAEPEWLKQADLHSIRPAFRADGAIDTGYACNVLLSRRLLAVALRSCRFDPSLGRSGGEDTFFFHQLHAMGARMAFCPTAIVREAVPAHRGRLDWLLKRFFRSGQTFARVLLSDRRRAPWVLSVAGAKAAYCLIGAGLRFASPAGWRRWLVRSALHVGVASKCLGFPDLQLY
jgi:succinoglycan biosynthesis protein ExoM